MEKQNRGQFCVYDYPFPYLLLLSLCTLSYIYIYTCCCRSFNNFSERTVYLLSALFGEGERNKGIENTAPPSFSPDIRIMTPHFVVEDAKRGTTTTQLLVKPRLGFHRSRKRNVSS